MLKNIIEFLGNLPEGVWYAVGILGVAVARKMIASSKLEEWFGKIMDGAGVSFSLLLISWVGKPIGSAIELIVIDLKRIVDTGIGKFVVGMRRDDEDKETAKRQYEAQKKANDEMRAKIVEKKTKAKIKGNANL